MKPRNVTTILFQRLLRVCRFSLYRPFLLKSLKGLFFQSLRYDPQRTIGLILLALSSSRHPIWSIQILELLSAVPEEDLDANQDAVNHFKVFQQSSTHKNILKAKLLLPFCFSVKASEAQKLLINYSDSKLNAFKTKETDSITMADLYPSHWTSITNWLKMHDLPAHDVNKDKGKFYNLVKQSAEAEDLESMFILGLLFSDGYGVEMDSEKAIYWLRAAATQQHAHAQCTIGYMFWGGWGAEKDEKQGMAWLETAAKNGNVIAKSAMEKIHKVKGSVQTNHNIN